MRRRNLLGKQKIDKNTIALLHFDSDNLLKDECNILPWSIVDNYGVSQSTNGKFGKCFYKGEMDNAQHVSPYASCIFTLSPCDYTLEFWLNYKWIWTNYGGWGDFCYIQGNGYNYKRILYLAHYPDANGKLYASPKDGSNYTFTCPQNTWVHLANVFDYSNKRNEVYLNGQKVTSYDSNITSDADFTNSEIRFGRRPYCYMDELRISNCKRYTSNFTPPTEPF